MDSVVNAESSNEPLIMKKTYTIHGKSVTVDPDIRIHDPRHGAVFKVIKINDVSVASKKITVWINENRDLFYEVPGCRLTQYAETDRGKISILLPPRRNFCMTARKFAVINLPNKVKADAKPNGIPDSILGMFDAAMQAFSSVEQTSKTPFVVGRTYVANNLRPYTIVSTTPDGLQLIGVTKSVLKDDWGTLRFDLNGVSIQNPELELRFDIAENMSFVIISQKILIQKRMITTANSILELISAIDYMKNSKVEVPICVVALTSKNDVTFFLL